MNGYCDEYSRLLEGGSFEGEELKKWAAHLHRCPTCSRQMAADEALRRELVTPMSPELTDEFNARLLRKIEVRRADAVRRGRRRGRPWPTWAWALLSYATTATVASILILSRLPWQSFAAPRTLVFALGVLVLLSPVVFLDRIGIVRPPG